MAEIVSDGLLGAFIADDERAANIERGADV